MQDELAAILRFGAEDLFKTSEKEDEEKLQKMCQEDIDSILERAEVVGTNEDQSDSQALLNQFSVATFKTGEDDDAFWSRLIPAPDNQKDEHVRANECNSCMTLPGNCIRMIALFVAL